MNVSTIPAPAQYRSISTEAEFQSLYQRLQQREATLAVVGLGYVGLPLALEFATDFRVIGYDINRSRIEMMQRGEDPSKELDKSAFNGKDIEFSSVTKPLKDADVIIVAVPTPVNAQHEPNLIPLRSACKAIAPKLQKGNIVIFESTVYPGCTEEVCIPVLEEYSGLQAGKDFKVGYSPERINPGDHKNTLTEITKIVSGNDEQATCIIHDIYAHIIKAGICIAPSIKVAEAAKIVENTQRDVNIALMNELSVCLQSMGINTLDVLKAAGTKWNFLNFYPGLVGGHCIGVDPYYLIHKAKSEGITLPLISAARHTNDYMPQEVYHRTKNALAHQGKSIVDARILFLGATFKENVSDIRNSKALELARMFFEDADHVDLIDPHADPSELNMYYSVDLSPKINVDYDVIIYAVNHRAFDTINWQLINDIRSDKCVVLDFKNILGAPEGSNDVHYMTL